MNSSEDISGELKRPDGSIEFFWKNQSYGQVLPEELIDESLKTDKKEDKNDDRIRKVKTIK